MSYLLDTNVLSETTVRKPAQPVIAWLASCAVDELFASAASITEVRYGIERLPTGARREALETWFGEAFAARPERIVPVDFEIADRWGRVRRRAEVAGRPMSLIDALIAATAEVRALTLVTRNVRDFQAWGGPVFDPWTHR